MDGFSSLPDEIICKIGSFLSAKEAAFTIVLSKRWQNLFTIIPNLHFDNFGKDEKDFKDFVEGVLALPATSRIRKFSLKWGYYKDFDPTLYDHVNKCLRHVLKHGVLVLELAINFGEEYSLPLEVFTCKTLTKLQLGAGFVIDILPSNVLLPALKTLILYSVRFYDFGRCAFETLLSASPVLEELVIDGVEWEYWKWCRTVASPTLLRLSIRRRDWSPYDPDEEVDPEDPPYNNESISFDTPSLTYLEYSDVVPKEYLIVNLNSLVEANLHFRVEQDLQWVDYQAKDFNPTNLINGLKNVHIMNLTNEAMEMLSIFHEAIPVFENLFHVSVSLGCHCWRSMQILLEKSPNLKTLIIEEHLHHFWSCFREEFDSSFCQCVSDYSFLWSCHVEVLQINVYNGEIGELEHMKHFLEKLSCLELVKIYAQVRSDDKRMQVMADLLMLPRASSKCRIEIEFSEYLY